MLLLHASTKCKRGVHGETHGRKFQMRRANAKCVRAMCKRKMQTRLRTRNSKATRERQEQVRRATTQCKYGVRMRNAIAKRTLPARLNEDDGNTKTTSHSDETRTQDRVKAASPVQTGQHQATSSTSAKAHQPQQSLTQGKGISQRVINRQLERMRQEMLLRTFK